MGKHYTWAEYCHWAQSHCSTTDMLGDPGETVTIEIPFAPQPNPTPPSDESPVGERKTEARVEAAAKAMWERTHDGYWPKDAEADATECVNERGEPTRLTTADIYRGDARAALEASLSISSEGAASVYIVICCNPDGSEVNHIFSSAEKAEAYAAADPRNHVLYDYLLDCPGRHEGRAQ